MVKQIVLDQTYLGWHTLWELKTSDLGRRVSYYYNDTVYQSLLLFVNGTIFFAIKLLFFVIQLRTMIYFLIQELYQYYDMFIK